MNWIKENNAIYLGLSILLITFCGCKYKPESELIKAKWLFQSIVKNGTPVGRITETDYLELKEDSTFNYHIGFINIRRNGTWRYNNYQLFFKYQIPDTTRVFNVNLISERKMIFTEAGIEFTFKKEE